MTADICGLFSGLRLIVLGSDCDCRALETHSHRAQSWDLLGLNAVPVL